MKKSITNKLAAVFVFALLAVAVPVLAMSHKFKGDLTTPSGSNPFGGDVTGKYSIDVHGSMLRLMADVDAQPIQGYVYEGWLVDMQTGYKLSLGQFRDNSLKFDQHMVNPWTYGVLVITSEPVSDLDPNPATPIAGALLQSPFGQ